MSQEPYYDRERWPEYWPRIPFAGVAILIAAPLIFLSAYLFPARRHSVAELLMVVACELAATATALAVARQFNSSWERRQQ